MSYTPPPPPLPTNLAPLPSGAKPPFARTAAQFCAWSPLFAIGIQLITRFGAVVMLVGIVMGIVALCGIPKHGRKGILIPSVIGLTINIAFIILAIVAFGKGMERAQAERARAAEQEQRAR